MTIEIAPASSEAKPPATTESKSTKGKSSEADKASADGASGFMAVLAAMDTSVVAPPVQDALQMAADPTTQVADASVAGGAPDGLGMEAPMDAAALLAQSLQWNPSQPDAAANPSADASMGVGNPMAPITPNAGAMSGRQSPAWASNAMQQGPNGDALAHASRRPLKATAPSEQASNQISETVALGKGAAVSGSNDAQLFQTFQKAEASLSAPIAKEGAAAVVAGLTRREDQGHDNSIFQTKTMDAALPPPATTASSPTTAVTNTSAAVTSTDVYVADQVKYWISNDVQNAEMKLDGIGNSPVEVSISMQGNEAQVAFRTDELRAREVLENAGAHLRDMLQREGLVLSGVSVGTSGAGDSGNQERKSQPGVRQMTVASVQSATSHSTSAAPRGAGRALDLFV